MRLLPPKFVPQYDSDDAEWANNDLFQRGGFAKSLTNLVTQVEEPLVMGLYAKWGEGKSTFVEMWKRQLDHINNVPTIYIDAFENDYFEDPFVCLTGEVYSYAKEKIGTETKMVKSIAEAGGKVGKIIAKTTANIALRAATAGMMDGKDLADVSGAFSQSLDVLLSKEISTYAEQKNALNAFRTKLTEVADKLGGGDRPLVIIVDELDRCKPTFALEMLERIKHLFAVENIVFVLVLNPEQMGCVIKRVYGDNVDATDYLHKFVDVAVSLPLNEGSVSKADYLRSILDREHNFQLNDIADLCQMADLSLREMQRVCILLNGCTLSANNAHVFDKYLAFLLAFLKIKHPKIYEKITLNTDVRVEIEKIRANFSYPSADVTKLFTDYEPVFAGHTTSESVSLPNSRIGVVEMKKWHLRWLNMFDYRS